jgi:pantothenate kinase
MLGIAGAPGAGKSLFAAASVRELGAAALVPMDGFHLADVVLGRLGLLGRKGAPETFDAWGYAALLARLRERPAETVYAPGFERDLEQPLAGAIAVPADVDVVVTEGNYLLLDRPEWRAVRAALDEVWFVFTDDAVRRERLVRRHVEFGKTPGEARAWVQRVDEPNARLVEASRHRATGEVDLTSWSPAS